MTSHEADPKGPFFWENWRCAQDGNPTQATYEFPLYTDGWVTGSQVNGDLDLGPYAFVNATPLEQHQLGILRPAVFLRVEDHFPPGVQFSPLVATDTARYHGGELEDEVAAVVSLCLGMRFSPGGVTRDFRPGSDPLGSESSQNMPWVGDLCTNLGIARPHLGTILPSYDFDPKSFFQKGASRRTKPTKRSRPWMLLGR